MGLDMYLMKKTGEDADGNFIGKELAYWRKANAIHGWFTRDLIDMGHSSANLTPFPQEKEDLLELASLCEDIIDGVKEPWELPTQSGFFFGSIEYDDWYFSQLEYTRDRLIKVAEEEFPLKDGEEVYYYAWY